LPCEVPSAQILAALAEVRKQILDLFESKGGWFGATILPTVDGRERYAEPGGHLLLGQSEATPELTDETGSAAVFAHEVPPG
jgi:hypothetical protein